MTIAERTRAEQEGGRLPVYVPREKPDPIGFGRVGDLACFYCGFGRHECIQHDYACRFLWWIAHSGGNLRPENQPDDNILIDVPLGGLKASQSFF